MSLKMERSAGLEVEFGRHLHTNSPVPEPRISTTPVPLYFKNQNDFTGTAERLVWITKKAKLRLGGDLTTPESLVKPKESRKMNFTEPRTFRAKKLEGPWSVSGHLEQTPMRSPHYRPDKKVSFYEQTFKQETKLGSGSFSNVYKVKCLDDNRWYAVKVVNYTKGKCDRTSKVQEVLNSEQLSHRNIVRFFDAWEESNTLYMKMELLTSSLSYYHFTKAEKQENLEEAEIWGFLVDLLNALVYLHGKDLVHLDIKPDNIFLTGTMMCKLGDLGLVVELKKMYRGEFREGDSKYMAPELLYDKGNAAADIFSLGITILELACDLDLPSGGPEWQILRKGEDLTTLMDSLMGYKKFRAYDEPPARSSGMRKVVVDMLQTDPADRPTAKDVLESLHLRKYVSQRNKFYKIVDEAEAAQPEPEPVQDTCTNGLTSDEDMDMSTGDDSSLLAVPFETSREDEVDGHCVRNGHGEATGGLQADRPRNVFAMPMPFRAYSTEPMIRTCDMVSSSTPARLHGETRAHMEWEQEQAGSPVSVRRPLTHGELRREGEKPKNSVGRVLFNDPVVERLEPPESSMIQPKNLAKMFDDMSDDGDDSLLS